MTRRDRSTTSPLPRPDEIARAPELAVQYVLQATLEVTVRALVATHPELADPEAPFWLREATPTTRAATELLSQIGRLGQAIHDYRIAIDLERDADPEVDPETPF